MSSSSAPLPPRKHLPPSVDSASSSESASKCHGSSSAHETLLQMGFSKARAEKALAATGSRGVQIAADWLVAHVHDPLLDEPAPRTYALYLCPSNGTPLQRQLQTFWDASSTQIGFNAAHNSFPHITLLSGVNVADGDVEILLGSVKMVADNFAREFANHGHLKLEKYISPNFVALFVGKNEEILLRSFVQELSESLSSSLGLSPSQSRSDAGASNSSNKSYHVTLAYQFSGKHFAGLKDLADAVDVEAGAEWELRLYSFDSRLSPKEVGAFKVVHAHFPNEPDELDLRVGDFIYVSEEEMLNDGAQGDGWVCGTSWLTGCSGFLPKNYVCRTPEPNAWTLHLSLPLGDLSTVSAKVSALSTYNRDMASPLLSSTSTSSLDRLKELSKAPAVSSDLNHIVKAANSSEVGSSCHHETTSTTNIHVTCDDTLTEVSSIRSAGSSRISRFRRRSPAPPRKLFIVRHGERVDFTFGAWIPYSFGSGSRKDLSDKKYIRKDLNMPHQVPQRRLGPEGYLRDCPLTLIGTVQAKLVGEAMKESGLTISHVYCSPSLRCVQTCHHILVGMGLAEQLTIHIEPGLFEWLAWYQDGMPDWMNPQELVAAGYNVEMGYKPYIPAEELQDLQEQMPPESNEAYYTRNFFVTQCVLQKTEEIGGNLLFVGHAATLDACSRQLVGKEQRSFDDMMNTIRKVAYCGVAMLQEEEVDGPHGSGHEETASIVTGELDRKRWWRVAEPPFPPITHCSNARFDWKILAD